MNWPQLVAEVRCLAAKVAALINGGGGGSYTAGDGLDLTGTEFSVDSTVLRNGGALGTPSSGTLTNATGLPVSTGISGLGTGVALFLGTPSSANLAAAVTGETGTGGLVFANAPTLVSPTLQTPLFVDALGATMFSAIGVGTVVNYVRYTATATGVAPILEAVGTDTNIDLKLVPKGTGHITDAAGLELGWKTIPSNPQSAAYTTVLADSGKSIDHPSTDNNARLFQIDGAVAYPIGAAITFTNMAATACTIAVITSGTLYLAGVGTTGTRTLGAFGVATARLTASGVWLISGSALT